MALSLDDSWLGASSRLGGTDGVRVRKAPPRADWKATAADLVTITWTCGTWERLLYGVPGPVTDARMEALEKNLATLTEATGTARLMAVVAHGPERTWHFYAADTGVLLKAVERAINDGRTGKLGIEVTSDPEWETWRRLAAHVAPPTVTHMPAIASEPTRPAQREQVALITDRDGPATMA